MIRRTIERIMDAGRLARAMTTGEGRRTILEGLHELDRQDRRQVACPRDDCPPFVFGSCPRFESVDCGQRIEVEIEIDRDERRR